MSNSFFEDLFNIHGRYMHLKLFIDSNDAEFKNKYTDLIKSHNESIINKTYVDAGFDLFSPETKLLHSSGVNKLDYNVICSAKLVDSQGVYNTSFYMYPRSSISKSYLRLANNVGIIDSGYRGHLIGMFDVIYVNETKVYKFDRHLQICAPGLIPIGIEVVESREELSETTSRGDGGFGSTGL
jgi:dUTP pyrophosphatase